ncbi:MAG: rod shape-determining protein MreD [Candidatus Firestonebacteria bacterium]
MIIRLIVIFVCFLFQSSSFISIFNISPDFILIGVVLVVLKNDVVDGIKIGIFAGLLQDVLSSGTFGIGLFTKTLSGFFAALLKKQIFSDSLLSKMLIVFLVVLINGASSLILMSLFYVKINIFNELYSITLPTAVYTSLLLCVLLLLKKILINISKKMLWNHKC